MSASVLEQHVLEGLRSRPRPGWHLVRGSGLEVSLSSPVARRSRQADPAERHTPEPAERHTPEASPAPGHLVATDPAERVRAALGDLGLDTEAVEAMARAAELLGAVTQGRDLSGDVAHPAGSDEATQAADRVLDGIQAVTETSARLDGALLAATRDLAVRTGRILLTRKGVADPDELSASQRRTWRGRAKSATRHEIEAATGWGAGEVTDLVGLASAPAAVSAVVESSLRRGTAPWRLARRYWRACGGLAHEDGAHIASALFGEDPATVVPERLTPEGGLSPEPWRHREFHKAVDREVTRVQGRDAHERRRTREQAHAARDTHATLSDDGTGAVVVTGAARQVAAIMDRLDRAARLARKHGDERTLAQLRADIALSLLMHSGLRLPDLPDDPELVTVEHSAALAQVLNAMPDAVLNVVVPWPVLSPGLAHPPLAVVGSAHQLLDAGGSAPPSLAPEGSAPPQVAPDPQQPSPPGADHPLVAAHRPQAPPGEQLAVAEVLGAFPLFQTPDEVRELVLQPGTTLHRLLTDPEDGRCRERTVTAYRPDAAMRAQILAADVTCRGPGCTHPGSSCQFDHVEEHGAGGPTAETNLHLAHGSHHDEKTQRFWDAALADNRDVTWTTLLGRIYRTRSHDYRQYLTVLQDAVEQVRSVPEAERGHAIDAAVYAALSYRPPASRLRAEDDDVDLDVTFTGWDHLRLTHRDDRGMLRPGAPAEVVDLERRRTPRVDGGEGDRPGAGDGSTGRAGGGSTGQAGGGSTGQAGGGSTEDSLVTSARAIQWDDEPPF